ncbi:MAG: tetratricopeptide repeat protein, partial [bacterium]
RLLADFDRHDAESGMKHLIAEQFAQQSEDAQLLLCALSVFSRPAPLAALRFLLPALDLAPVLPRLVRNKLVRMERDLLSLHPLVKEWIYRQLPEEGEGVLSRAALHRKAADFYHSLRLPQAQWKRIEDLEPHLAEIRHRTAAGDDQEAAAVLEAIAETLEQWSEFLLLIELTEPLLERLSDPHLQASCRIWLGRALCKTGRGEEAISLLEQALELARRSADRPCEAIALRNLGIVYGDRGQLDRAEEHHRASLENARQIGDFMKEAIAFGNLGWVYHERGELPPAEEYFRASLEIACRIGDRYLEGKVLGNLGVVYSDRGELDRAEEHHRASLEITRQIGDREQEGIALGNLGMVHGDRGQLDRAEEHHRASLEIARRIGDRSTESNELNNLGLVFLERGDQVQARACWTEGLRVARECQSKSFQEESLLRLGELSRLEGDLVSAQAGLQEGLALAREIEDPWGEALGLLGQGKLEESRGDWESAKAFFQRSLAVAGESGYADLSAQARLALGRGYLRWHRPAEARTYLEKALAVELPKMSCLAALTLGIQELEEGNRPEAEQYLRRAVTLADGLLEKAPDRWEIRYARALAHLAAGEPEEAQADYARAITTFSAPGALQDAQADLALLRRAAPAIPGLDRVEELLRSAERASPD